MRHRQDNLLANRTLLPGMASGQYVFRLCTFSPVVRYFSLLPCLCILSFSSPAAMLSPGDRSAIQQQQQQLLDENQRQRDALERSAPLTITPSPETSAGTEGPCFTVSRIVVSGATRLTSAETDSLVAPWVNQCLNITGLPKVAVDTGALGGMYARRIHLTSTESGVGVNLGNLYAREGDIILSSSGKLVLKNSLAGGNTTVTGTDVSLSGDNKAGGNLSVTGTTGLTLNQSRLVTDKNLVLSSSGQIVQNGGELTAGQNAMLSAQHLNQTSGTVNAAENVTLTTTDDTTLKGRSVAGKTLTVSSGSLNNGGTLVAGRDATVKTLSAGNNVSVTATGKNKDHNNSGDILITGSQIKSGNDTSLNAQNDILLAAAADTRQTTGKNSSKGGGVGVSFGGGTNGGGLSIFAGINGSEGREKGNGTTWTETTVDAGKNVSLTSGHDTTLSGAQVSGEKVTADVGNNLTISSLQDSDRYDSRQNSVAAGGSFTFGSMSGSGYASISQDKIKSNYDSVREQSGIYAGKDGFDVTVGNHTQLNGAVIASTATDDKNSLSTGTLGWSDIHNQADYKASHTGISLSGGSGMSASQMVASNAIAGAANALTGMSGSSGHAEGTTSSAISGGNLIIRNKESQKQDIAGLSRDPENANGSIAPIFDREKEQKRLQEAQVISQISGQMSNIVMTYGETEAMKAARKEHPGMSDAQLRETPEYREVMKGYGTGSTPQMVVQAITGVLGGLNAGNPGQILAGGLNPAVAQLIKQATGDNREANLMAHAVWGALAAQLGGNNAASGAAGAFSGELAARYIIDNYYGGRTDSLSEQERQQISMLATIASGIAGGLAGNSTASAGTGAQAGRNAVENNLLSPEKDDRRFKALEAQKAGQNLLKASQDIFYLTNEDKYNDKLIAGYKAGKLDDAGKAELARFLNEYGTQLQLYRGMSEAEASQVIDSILKYDSIGPVLTKEYNEAYRYLNSAGVHLSQAVIGTDALLAGPGRISQLMRLSLAAGGSYQTGKGIAQVSDGKIAEGGTNIALGSAAIFGGYVGNKVVGKPSGGIISPESKVIQESSWVLDKKTHTSIPKVEAELIDKESGKIFKDTNQGNRSDYFLGDKSRPTLINDRIEAKIEKNPSKDLPNGNMASAHAEVGTIQQAFEDGITVGRDMNMRVTKEPVCGYCRGDIAAMADKAGLKSLTVYEESTGKTLYWNPGMKSLKEKK